MAQRLKIDQPLNDMLAKNDEAEYMLDNYGECDRGADCYHGRDALGHFDGCLRIGWKGRQCKHWKPLGVTSLEELKASSLNRYLT